MHGENLKLVKVRHYLSVPTIKKNTEALLVGIRRLD